MTHILKFLSETQEIARKIDQTQIEHIIQILLDVRERNGRLFFLGVGGSAANCSHAVNDFRKLAHVDAYTPVDNVSELTARVNDDGWQSVFSSYLEISNLSKKDAIFILSVGGGSREGNISTNLIDAMDFSKRVGAKIIGVVGRDGGYTAKVADAFVLIPTLNSKTITPHTESWQVMIVHMIVSDPRMMKIQNKWESLDRPNIKLFNSEILQTEIN